MLGELRVLLRRSKSGKSNFSDMMASPFIGKYITSNKEAM